MCLGGQLMGAPLSGREGWRVNEEFEFGFLPIEITPEGREDPLLAGLAARASASCNGTRIRSAFLRVGVRLMTGTTCLNQAFRFGKTAYGFQCHWEVSVDLAKPLGGEFRPRCCRSSSARPRPTRTVGRAKTEFEKYGRRAHRLLPRSSPQRWADLVTAAKNGLIEKSDERARRKPRHSPTRHSPLESSSSAVCKRGLSSARGGGSTSLHPSHDRNS